MTGSRKAAIDGHCHDCIVDPSPGNGTALAQITRCTSYQCKLFPFRPRQPNWSDESRSFISDEPDPENRTLAGSSGVIASDREAA